MAILTENSQQTTCNVVIQGGRRTQHNGCNRRQ